jgi:hypothetical protein
MKKVAIFIGFLLFVIPTSWAQEKIQAPVWKAGEKWTFRYDTGGDWSIEIIGEEKGLYVDATTRIKGRMPGTYTRYYDKNSLNCVSIIKDGKENVYERDSLNKYFDFYLYVGKTWSYSYEMISPSNQTFRVVSELSAVQYEEIEVPAGKFKTIKVKNKLFITGGTSSGILNYWWSPDAKTVVRVEYEPSKIWNPEYSKFELISFYLK